MESKIAHFQKTVRETLSNSANRSDWDELDVAAEELYKLMYDSSSDTAASNLVSDVLKMYHSAVYSTRALCHMRLEKMPQALEDAEKCIELHPKFSGGYFRKGSVLILMNDYKKAFDTFQEGLKHSPTDKCLLGGAERCIQKLHEASSGDNSGKDKTAEGTILSQQEKGESSSIENVTKQEKGKTVEGTTVFQQEKGKCCSFNEHVIDNMPTVNPTLPTVKPIGPGNHFFGMKLSKLILIAEVVSIFADFMELPVLGMMCSVVAVLGNLESAKRDHYKPFSMLKLLFASVQLITCMLMCLSELMDKEIKGLEAFGREARPYHLCMLLISLSLHH